MVEVGAYVLGALTSGERSAYERHLASCPSCREEVAELAVLPGLLGRVDAPTVQSLDVPAEPAPPHLLLATLHAAQQERHRSRRWRHWRLGAGIAAALLAAAVGLSVTIVKLSAGPSFAPVVAQMTPVDPGVPVSALMGYSAASGGGTDIQMLCLYRRADGYGTVWTVRLVVYARGSGIPQALRSWAVHPGTDVTVTSHTDLAPDQIARIELTRTDAPPGGPALLVYQTT